MNEFLKWLSKKEELLIQLDKINSFQDIKKLVNKNLIKNEEIEKIKRKIKDMLPIILKRKNKTPEEKFILYMFKYRNNEKEWYSPKEYTNLINETKTLLKNQGFIQTDFPIVSKIYNYGFQFYKPHNIIQFFLTVNNSMEYIEINDDLFSVLNKNFHVEIKGPRAFSSLLERYNDIFCKVDNRKFKLKNINEKNIAVELKNNIKKIKFNFLIIKYLKILCYDIVKKYNLILDEPYYILKKHFPNTFYYSKGNSMYIARKTNLLNLSSIEKIKKIIKNDPLLLTKEEFSLKTGISEHATINFQEYCRKVGEFILLVDEKNERHIKIIKNVFLPFLEEREGLFFKIKELKEWLEKNGNDLISKRLASVSYVTLSSVLKRFFKDKLTLNKNEHVYLYKNEQEKYIDLNNWDDF